MPNPLVISSKSYQGVYANHEDKNNKNITTSETISDSAECYAGL